MKPSEGMQLSKARWSQMIFDIIEIIKLKKLNASEIFRVSNIFTENDSLKKKTF